MFFLGALEGIHAQVDQKRCAQRRERLLPYAQAFGVLLQERGFPVAVAQGRDAAVIGPIDELLARPFALALERRHQVVAVEMDLVGACRRWSCPSASSSLMSGSPAAASSVGSMSSWAPMSLMTVPGLIDARPADQRRHAVAAFPVACSSRRGTSSCRHRAR